MPRLPPPVADCACRPPPAPPATAWPASGASKGRGGKSVTLVRGLPMAGPALEQLGKQLRTTCGSGGTVRTA